MGSYIGYQCSLCEETYDKDQVAYICPKDGGNLNVLLDLKRIKQQINPSDIINHTEASLWRYLPLLPVKDPGNYGTPFRRAGYTPVFKTPSLGNDYGIPHLWVKDESRNPTASFKDRASAVVVARAREIKAEVVVTASTGNAGAALAGMAAAVNQKAVIFAPRNAPPAKVAQLLVFGAQVILVDGNYDSAFDLTIEAAEKFGWYCRNTGFNPFTVEGKKTAAFEIWEWWETTRREFHGIRDLVILVSVGDGNIISGIHKGFKDLVGLGWLDVMPKIIGVQAVGSAAIHNAFHAGKEEIEPVSANTLADSISVDLPRDGVRAVRAARQTGGTYIAVEDQEILQAISELGKVGIFAEPAGATSYAGFVRAAQMNLISSSDAVLVLNTGSGLKDVKAAMLAVGPAPVIEPNMASLLKYLRDKNG